MSNVTREAFLVLLCSPQGGGSPDSIGVPAGTVGDI